MMKGLSEAEETAVQSRLRTRAERAGDAAAQAPVAVRVDGLSVRLSLQKEVVTSLRETVIRIAERRPVEVEEFWPLRDVSFTVHRGEAFGIVGRNGAGKSTLLKVVAGVIAPTLGRVEVRGRIAPLLELGAGFDAEMTGRENVFLYGSLLGFPRRALVERFDRIVEFAELAEFIDVPLKNYSSGMAARLGFAIAIDVDADLLIVDETLTVGDSRFQLKCMERIENFQRHGATILFVSHNPDQVRRLCSRALWIENGLVRHYGAAEEVLGAYEASELEPPTARGAESPRAPEAVTGYVEPEPREGALPGDVGGDALSNAYDFLDLSQDGARMAFCSHLFGGSGIGLTETEKGAEQIRRFGFDTIKGSPLDVDFPPKNFRYVSAMDSLYLKLSQEVTETVIARAARWTRDFLFIRLPSFEEESYLRAIGLKHFWADWSMAPFHLRLDQLTAMLRSLELDRFSIVYRYPSLSSDSPSILPLSAPPNQGEYDPILHGPKPLITFPHPVYEQIDVFVPLRDFEPEEWREIVSVSAKS
jgi:ABC-2 type transport system ATP-binding protein/lipopolysaccharide transport system ATP-binding protein